MAVYFKYKSAKDYDSVPILDPFISVGNLKLKIFESKRFGRGKDFDLIVTNAQTNDDYIDQHALIPKNTSVLIRRVPGIPCLPIVIPPVTTSEPLIEEEPIVTKDFQDAEYDDFGEDVYAVSKVMPIQSSNNNTAQDVLSSSIDDKESCKIKSLTVDTPESNNYGFGRGGMMGWKQPPVGYVCHRCKVPGHFIQHCPTNGDPNYDIKKVKPPTGIPKSMLMATPSGSVGVLKPDEAAFAKEVEGLSYSSSSSSSSKRSFSNIPPELYCPLCRQVMKDAVIASKCCFSSFCDKCIRDHIISKSACICGVRNILADTLLPNVTLRASITRIVEANNSSSDHSVSAVRVQDVASSKSAASKGDVLPPAPPQKEKTCRAQERLESGKSGIQNGRSCKPASHEGNAPLAVEEVQEKPIVGEAGKMKKRKTTNLPSDAAAAAAYHPGWTGMQYMNYGHHHVLPHEAFGGQGFMYMLPFGPLPQGDLSNIFQPQNSFGRQHFEARTASLKRKRDLSRDQLLVL